MDPPPARLSANDLPAVVLARIFTSTDPRGDALALLLTCRHWLAVAEAECCEHLWGVIVVSSDDRRLAGQQAQAALLAGLRRRAACLRELRIMPRRYFEVTTCARFTPLWPTVLRAVQGASRLRSLRVDTLMTVPPYFVSACEAICGLTLLQQLTFQVSIPSGSPLLPAVSHLFTLTRLEQLELRLFDSTGELPPALLPTLGSLTRLDLTPGGRQSVIWQRPDGSGPTLRQLRLSLCDIGLPADRLLRALRQLEWLELYAVALEEAHVAVLAQLPHLTFLVMGSMQIPWPAVLRCAGLQELVVDSPLNPPPAHLPAGSLPQLARLVQGCAHASPAWLALPQLRSLKLTNWHQRAALPPSLGQCLQLEELEVWGRSLREITWEAAPCTRLTRLVVAADVNFTQPQGLQEGPYLFGLRQLTHFILNASRRPLPTWRLPAFLASATSLELLDLGRDSSLRLRGAEDAPLLRTLPRLRRVALPLDVKVWEAAAAAVDRIREELREGAAAEAGPWHAVEVEGVVVPG